VQTNVYFLFVFATLLVTYLSIAIFSLLPYIYLCLCVHESRVSRGQPAEAAGSRSDTNGYYPWCVLYCLFVKIDCGSYRALLNPACSSQTTPGQRENQCTLGGEEKMVFSIFFYNSCRITHNKDVKKLQRSQETRSKKLLR